MNVTANDIWRAVNNDPKFMAQPASVREVTRPFVEALPDILSGTLDQNVTLESLMDAKIKFLRHLIKNNYIKKVVAAMPEESLGFFDRKDLSSTFQSMFEQLIEMMEPLSKDALTILKKQGVTEEQVMLSSKVGLAGKALKLYKEKKLTLGQVLVLQPMLIVDNTSK